MSFSLVVEMIIKMGLDYYIDNVMSVVNGHQFVLLLVVLSGMMVVFWRKREAAVYLLELECSVPPKCHRMPMAMFLEHMTLDRKFDSHSITFQTKILEKSGFSDETFIPSAFFEMPIRRSIALATEEGVTNIFPPVTRLLQKTSISPKMIDVLITNCSLFSPTPSLSAMIANRFGMRTDVKSFNLSGMGCCAGVLAAGLANDLLKVHPNSLALIVSTEILSLNRYTGKNRSMLLPNCLFRMGSSAVLMSTREQDKVKAKYKLQHFIRTVKAQEEQSYTCVYEDVDSEDEVGVSITKSILYVAGNALRTNIATLGPRVLPYSEQIQFAFSVLRSKLKIGGLGRKSVYTPKFKKAFKHFSIHAGGKAIIETIKEKLGLEEEDVEASKMTLYRFGNTSSSSIWYSLCYTEAKGRVKKGDCVWQIAFGSGFKCGTAVWKCISDVPARTDNAWGEIIHKYPVDIPESVKIT